MAEDRNALADEIERLTSAMSLTDHSESRAATGVLAQTVCLNAGIVLAALRSDAGAEMRERAAKFCDGDAATFFEAARQWREAPNSPGASMAYPSEFAGTALEAAARTIRALPLTPTEDRRDAS